MVLQLAQIGVDYEGAEFVFADDINARSMQDALGTAGMFEPPAKSGVIFGPLDLI